MTLRHSRKIRIPARRAQMRVLPEQKKVKVVHFVQSWLPQTMTWLYSHLKHLPESVESYVVCNWTQNLDQFPMENLFSLERPPQAPSLIGRVCRRLGMWDGRGRHLGLLGKVIQELGPEILHSHFGQCGWDNARLARKYGLRHVVSFYGLDVGYLPTVDARWISRYRQMSGQVDLILCLGPHMARSVASLCLAPEKIKLFRLGVDLTRIPFAPRKNTVGGPLRFLIAGSFREKKGIPYALEALGLFSQTYSNLEITVIGDSGGSEGEEREKRKIMETVERCGLGEKTRLLGYQPYDVLLREFYRHHIFVSPSVTSSDGDTEGAPVTIIEAAASGMPIISTQHADIPFILSERNAAYLVNERDSQVLCEAIIRLVSSDWQDVVASNRRLIEEELDVGRQGQRLYEIYRELL